MSGIARADGGRRVAVVVDGSATSACVLRHGASQARQRNALLDVISIVPSGADPRAIVSARVRLGEFTRRECPYGVGAPVRLRVECGDPQAVLAQIASGAELLLTGDRVQRPAQAAGVAAGQAGPGHPVTGRLGVHLPWWRHPLAIHDTRA